MGSHGAMKEKAMMAHKPEKAVLMHIMLSPAENGGVVAEHRMSTFEGPEKKYVFGPKDGKGLAAHLGEHLGHAGMSAMGKDGEED